MSVLWIVVADRSRARLFRAEAPRSIVETEDHANPDGRARERDLVSDRPSRMPEMPAHARGALDSPSPEEHAAMQFARMLCDRLELGRTAGDYDRLVVIAPPEFLGMLRQAAGVHLRRSTVLEIGKNLTERSSEDIRAYLPPGIWSDLRTSP